MWTRPAAHCTRLCVPRAGSSVETKTYRDHGTILQYVYYDKDGGLRVGIKVLTSTCS